MSGCFFWNTVYMYTSGRSQRTCWDNSSVQFFFFRYSLTDLWQHNIHVIVHNKLSNRRRPYKAVIFTGPLISQTQRSGRPRQKYTRGCRGPRLQLKYRLRHFAHPLTFTGMKKSELWSGFSTRVPFVLPAFQSRTTYLKSKTNSGSADDWSSYVLPKFGVVWSPTTDKMAVQIYCPKNEPKCIGRSCWNLV